MAKKRVRQKQRMANKTLEGYEKHLLQQMASWESAYQSADTPHERQTAGRNVSYYKRAHEHLRKYYFDL